MAGKPYTRGWNAWFGTAPTAAANPYPADTISHAAWERGRQAAIATQEDLQEAADREEEIF